MSVEVATLRARPAVAVRSVVPMSDLDVRELFGAALGRLFPYLGEHGLAPAGAPYARYAEFRPERADVEIGVPLAADGALGLTVLPGGEVATYLHVGPYPDLVQAYQAIESWLAESGRSAGGAPWEVYEVGPEKVDDDPARLETLVCWPLA